MEGAIQPGGVSRSMGVQSYSLNVTETGNNHQMHQLTKYESNNIYIYTYTHAVDFI